MTEEEARTKWCPYRARVAQTSIHMGYEECMASDCIMWRWDVYEWDQEKKDKGIKGHCGLGGEI